MQNFLKARKSLTTGILFAALIAGSVSSAQAEDVAKGVLIVRDGAANTDANYQNQERDSNDRLDRVSALCARSNNQTVVALVATDTTRVWVGPMSGNTTTVIKHGGHVVKDPLPGNPNHCLINGLTLAQIKGMWH